MSASCVLTDEAREEVDRVLGSREYYVGINGKMSFSANSDIVSLILANITG